VDQHSLAAIPPYPLFPSRGASFRTHVLLEEQGQIRFEPTLTAELFFAVFQFMGLLGILIGGAGAFAGGFEGVLAAPISVGIGIGFWWLGGRERKKLRRTVELDVLRRTIRAPREQIPSNQMSAIVTFQDVLAVQIISKCIHDSEHSYTSYELNLVLRNRERIGIVDHADEDAILSAAKRIAAFLECPVVRD
jgi:hypothetical protein